MVFGGNPCQVEVKRFEGMEKMAEHEDKISYRPEPQVLFLWSLALVLLSAGICWFFTQNWMACASVGMAGAVVLEFFSRDAARRGRRGLFIELQLFLVRCRILPEDYKINRNPGLSTLEKSKRDLMDMA